MSIENGGSGDKSSNNFSFLNGIESIECENTFDIMRDKPEKNFY